MEVGSIAKKGCCRISEKLFHVWGSYFQQTQKGRMRMVAMGLVPEYLKGEGWPGRWLEDRCGSYGKSPAAKNRFDFSVVSNF